MKELEEHNRRELERLRMVMQALKRHGFVLMTRDENPEKLCLVEHCKNWRQMYIARGKNCYNCSYRDGFPDRAQPDKKCANYEPMENES